MRYNCLVCDSIELNHKHSRYIHIPISSLFLRQAWFCSGDCFSMYELNPLPYQEKLKKESGL